MPAWVPKHDHQDHHETPRKPPGAPGHAKNSASPLVLTGLNILAPNTGGFRSMPTMLSKVIMSGIEKEGEAKKFPHILVGIRRTAKLLYPRTLHTGWRQMG